MAYIRYALTHIVTAAGAVALYWVVQTLLDFSIVSSFFPVLPSMVGAMVQGAAFAKSTGRAPESGTAWRFAGISTAISIALLTLQYFALDLLYPAFIETLLNEIGRSILGPVLAAALVVVVLLVNRYVLTSYTNMILKAEAARRDKR